MNWGILCWQNTKFSMMNWNQPIFITFWYRAKNKGAAMKHKRLTIFKGKPFLLLLIAVLLATLLILLPRVVTSFNILRNFTSSYWYDDFSSSSCVSTKSHLIVSCKILLLLFQIQKCLCQWQIGASKVICLLLMREKILINW